MSILCQEVIWLPEKGTNTYCMNVKGHEGECSPYVKAPITRHEMELIPEGVSLTETEVAWYIRVRKGNSRITLRVRKKDLSLTEDYKECPIE